MYLPVAVPHGIVERWLRSGARGLQWASLWFGVCCVQACTTIVVKQGAETVSVERRFGFASITLGTGAEGVLAEAQTWGVLASPVGVAVGYTSQQIAALDGSCRLVFWVRNPQEVERITALLDGATDVCTISSSGER